MLDGLARSECDWQPYGSKVRLRRHRLVLLTIGQVLGGLGIGAAFSVLAANDLAGEAWSGLTAGPTAA
jgi:hypothetical protein